MVAPGGKTMNKIVRKTIRAGDLPASLRGDLPAETLLDVTLEPATTASATDELLAMIDRRRPILPPSTDGVARVRALRDEWEV
jgi:hypothetical protein